MTPLEHLSRVDRETKPKHGNEDWKLLQELYNDEGLEVTQRMLDDLGLGVRTRDGRRNEYPIRINFLRRAVDRIAAAYNEPASRELILPTGELAPLGFVEYVLGKDFDIAMRRVDRDRVLHNQICVRAYPSAMQKRVVLRVFPPHTVLRQPGAEPDCMDADVKFALNIGTPAKPVYEYYEQLTGGGWVILHLDSRGIPLLQQPFPNLELPYEKLPVAIMHAEWANGKAWLPPRKTRANYTLACDAMINDLWHILQAQAHELHYANARRPDDVPEISAPDEVWVVPEDVTVNTVKRSPKIEECENVLQTLLRLFMLENNLPGEELQPGREILTGAALLVQEAPLNTIRREYREMFEQHEGELFERWRAVHNAHALEWQRPWIPEGRLEVELGEPQPAVTIQERIENVARELALGTISIIDAIRKVRRVTRSRAIKIYEQIMADRLRYPGLEPVTSDALQPARSLTQAAQAALLT